MMSITNLVTQIKYQKPLILNITNHVSIDFIANGLLSLGASPVMSFATSDVDDLIKISNALVINLGTLNDEFMQLCDHACRWANKYNVPVILDPVGAGASQYRTHMAQHILKTYQIAIVRGNASEIMALSDADVVTKGVDSVMASDQAIHVGATLAKIYQNVFVISGAIDFVINEQQVHSYSRGSAMMPLITGTGCLLSAVVAAFQAVEKDSFKAAAAATLFYSVCGEIAAKDAPLPGTFKTKFIDALHTIPAEQDYA